MKLSWAAETWPIRGTFTLSRGTKTETAVVVVTLRDGEYQGRGECVPYMRYGETIQTVQEHIASVKSAIENGVSREELQRLLPPGAARNAVDCALWDLEAKRSGTTVWQLVGLTPQPLVTAFTISFDTPEAMAKKAAEAKRYSLLKIKLGGNGDEERLKHVREAAPSARLIADANEGWKPDNLEKMVRACEQLGIELIEQPLPANNDEMLASLKTSIKICADESAHTSADIPKLARGYTAVNIKLDKTGGLTEALAMARAARDAGLSMMVGCMVSTSLSMAPATVIAQYADYVDLDGPLLLAKDREPAIEYRNGEIIPTIPALWG
jgi:L-alanine-DL-glutamate epimerase-like enolase superfamily enzyme